MKESGLYNDVPWDDLEALHKARMDKQTYDIHWVAHALRHDRCGPQSKLPVAVFDTVRRYLKEQLPEADAAEAIKEFTRFRLKKGGSNPDDMFAVTSIVYDDSFSPIIAWGSLEMQGCVLAPIAVKVLDTLANSVPSERSFSATNHVHSKEQNRLTTEKADKQTFCYMNSRVLRRLRNPIAGSKRRWADLEEKDWVDLEDAYLDMFLNAHGRQTYMQGDGQWDGVMQATGDMVALGTELEEESSPDEADVARIAKSNSNRQKKRRRGAK